MGVDDWLETPMNNMIWANQQTIYKTREMHRTYDWIRTMGYGFNTANEREKQLCEQLSEYLDEMEQELKPYRLTRQERERELRTTRKRLKRIERDRRKQERLEGEGRDDEERSDERREDVRTNADQQTTSSVLGEEKMSRKSKQTSGMSGRVERVDVMRMHVTSRKKSQKSADCALDCESDHCDVDGNVAGGWTQREQMADERHERMADDPVDLGFDLCDLNVAGKFNGLEELSNRRWLIAHGYLGGSEVIESAADTVRMDAYDVTDADQVDVYDGYRFLDIVTPDIVDGSVCVGAPSALTASEIQSRQTQMSTAGTEMKTELVGSDHISDIVASDIVGSDIGEMTIVEVEVGTVVEIEAKDEVKIEIGDELSFDVKIEVGDIIEDITNVEETVKTEEMPVC